MDAAAALETAKQLLERYVKGGGDVADRDRGVDLFEIAISSGTLAPDDELKARAGIGMLLALRIFPVPFGPGPAMPDIQTFLGLMSGGISLDSEQTRSDMVRARTHLRHVATTAPGTEVADHVVGLLMVLELFAVAPDPASAGPDTAPGLRTVLDGALEELSPSPRRDLIAGLRSVLLLDTPAGADLDRDPATLLTALQTMLDTLPPDAGVRPTLLGDTALLLAHFGADGDPAVTMADAPRLLEEALATIGADDPLRADLERRLAGTLVAWAAGTADPGAIDRVVAAAEKMLAEEPTEPTEPAETAETDVTRGRDHFLRAMALALRARRDSDPDDLRAAVADLGRAMSLVPASDPITPAIAATYGAILNDRSLADGVFEDADAARYQLEQARDVLRARAVAGADTDRVEALALIPRAVSAIRRRDADLGPLVDDLDAAARRFPDHSSWRARLTGILGLAKLAHGMTRGETGLMRAGLDDMSRAAAATNVDVAGRSALTALGAVSMFVGGLLDDDHAQVATAVDRLSDPATLDGLGRAERVGVSVAGGMSRLAHFEATHDRADLDAGIAQLTAAAEQIADDDGNPFAPQVLHLLAGAHARRADGAADRDRSVELGLAGLRAHTASALLQSTTAHALRAVTAAADDARRVATWCLDADRPADAVTAIELGRGLVLHATVSAGRLPAMMRDAGHPELADEWEAAGPDPEPVRWTRADGIGPFLDGSAPNDLRRRVLTALRSTPAIRGLLTSPEPADIADALLRTGRDALVYLLPADGPHPGRLLVVDAAARVVDLPAPDLRVTDDGPVAAFLRADDEHRVRADGPRLRDLDPPGSVRSGRWTQLLADVCDWAYPAVIAPLLTAPGDRLRSVVLVAGGALNRVPWPAARRPGTTAHEYACADLLLSSAASARQLVDAAARGAAPTDGIAVLVADPTGGLPGATAEVEALRDSIYTDAVVLGTARGAAGRGTPGEVLGFLAGAGLLHLACHASTGASSDASFLRLAPTGGAAPGGAAMSEGAPLQIGDVLRRARHRATDRRMVLVLSACTSDVSADAHDEALTLATAFLAAGATTVVGSLWAVPDTVTPVLMYMFHHHLTVHRRPAAEALRAAQLWMLDPDRTPPPGMPDRLIRTAHSNDLTAIDAWAAFAHHGA